MFRNGPASVWHVLTRRSWLRLVEDYTDDCKRCWFPRCSSVVALIISRSEQVYHYIARVAAGKTGSQPESKHLMFCFGKYQDWK